MQISNVPFTNIVWSELPIIESFGDSGFICSRILKTEDICVRIVEFSPGYRADHWCSKGHVVLVLDGILTTVMEDGRTFVTKAGDSFLVGDGDGRHRAQTEDGAKLFIVD